MFSFRLKLCQFLSIKSNIPLDQVILVISILMTIPCCYINYFIKGKNNRLLYSLILGFSFHYSIYGINTIHTIMSTISTYLFIHYLGRKATPFYVVIYTIIHLDILHIYRMIVDYGGWTVDDAATIYMIFLCKYTSVAFSYDDGRKCDKDIISEHHRKYKIVEKPSILEFCSYIYFYPTSIIGPFIEYKDFINFIEEKECYSNLKNRSWDIFKKGITTLSFSFIFMAVYVFLGPIVPMALVGKPEFPKLYPHLWQRLIFLYLSGPPVRAKYYSGWLLSYSTVVFSGAAYGEKIKDGKITPQFEKGSYGSILFTEFGMNPKLKMNYWNMSIHMWLKYNIYTRLLGTEGIFKNNKTLDSFITFVFSALWHGFYQTYFISFVSVYLFEQCATFLEQLGFYKFVENKKILWPFVGFKSVLIIDGIGCIFYVLEFENFKNLHKNLAGFPLNYLVGIYIISLVYNLLFKKKKTRTEHSKAESLNEKNVKEKVKNNSTSDTKKKE